MADSLCTAAAEIKTADLLTGANSGLILWLMSKETLSKAVALAGGQTALARKLRAALPESKVSQVHVWNWLNVSQQPVPPADMVLPISRVLGFAVTPHQLRPDLYPNPGDALPYQPAARAA